MAATKARHGRVIAVGTTVVRALEHAAMLRPNLRAGRGLATQRIGAHSVLRVVDAILTGVHEPGDSHYELVRAFLSEGALRRLSGALEASGYRTHEFGDSVFIARAGSPRKLRLALATAHASAFVTGRSAGHEPHVGTPCQSAAVL